MTITRVRAGLVSCRRRIAFLMLLAPLLWSAPAQAILSIEITQGADVGIPIAIVPFAWQGQGKPPQDLAEIISNDLVRSGRFISIPRKDFVSFPKSEQEVVYKDWRVIKAEALVIGTITPAGPGRFDVQFRLFDVFKQAQLAGLRYTVSASLLRTVAHQIADVVYEKLTGEPGAFNTRIAYVTREAANPKAAAVYRLQIADSDGHNPRTVVRSPEPLLSPAWSPDGKRIAYVSFEDKRSKVYIQNLADGRRELIAEFAGINSAPAWSPDGRRLALALSRDGNAEIYVLDLQTRRLQRLTSDPAIDTEPSWSPDGRYIVFTSDRAGRPQIYRMTADGRQTERLTFEGEYNARASYSPDGRMLTLVSAQQGRFRVATLQLDSGALQVLTDTALDESPTFAPNGRIILYATEVRGRGVLASVSSDGRVRQLYRLEEGDVREPAWSPYNRELQY
ncbi:MAG TPA: Tol-Pal system beta propeller repeat protein TolB [Burkholderiales bacterium]